MGIEPFMTKNTKKGTKQDGTIGTTGGMGPPLKKEVLCGRDVGGVSRDLDWEGE